MKNSYIPFGFVLLQVFKSMQIHRLEIQPVTKFRINETDSLVP